MQHFDAPNKPTVYLDLTEREREILALLTRGFTNTAIAECLSLSVKIVRNRMSDIFGKRKSATAPRRFSRCAKWGYNRVPRCGNEVHIR
jgi:DNA-binding NarL/FixJ family response regulator